MTPRRGVVSTIIVAALAFALTIQAASAEPARGSRMAGGGHKVWVFFADKGLVRGGERAAIDAFRAELPERALSRRAKVGFDVNWNDLPLAAHYVDGVAATGVEVVTKSRWRNAVSVLADADQAAAIAALPFVRETRPVASGVKRMPEFTPAEGGGSSAPPGRTLDYGEAQGQIEQIQIDRLHDEGLDGSGVLIAMLDTGFDTDHQAYRHLDIVAERDFINDDTETANEPGDPEGQDGHGTATLSCVGGKYPGELFGGSYEAGFVLCKTEMVDNEILVEEDYWQEAVEWADSLGADVVSSSLGYFDWYDYEDMDGNTAGVTRAADMAAARGIVVVNSMGNEGDDPWLYMIAPADGDSVLSVGAVDIDGIRTDFSSVGPTYDGRIKPDIMALGQAAYVATTADTASYSHASGTSFSCPLTAGAVGLLVQAHPDWTPLEVINALRTTATQSSTPDTLMGWGIVQAFDARYAEWSGVEGSQVPVPRVVWASPNPSSHGTNVQFVLSRRGRAVVAVYNATGGLVRTLVDRVLPSGPHAVEWDGRDETGQPVASGVYFAKLLAAGGVRSSAKVVVVR